jgi:NADP-dependent 3-hydroxy acid dehydrogenase YdfG
MKVIVTGASKGIGRGIARILGARGCVLGLTARSVELLSQLEEEIRAEGGVATSAACDLRDAEKTEQAISKLIEELEGVDGLINNAGVVVRKDAASLSIEEWRSMVDTNLNGLFYATKAVLPRMIRQGHGHIVNISSISGYQPLAGGSGYAATKFAVTGFSESLFHEVRHHGIKVTTVFPGSVETESHRHAGDESEWRLKPEEVGEAVHSVLTTRRENCISRVEIRPLMRPGR